MGLSLKKFIKYFDDMTKMHIRFFPDKDDDERCIVLFEGNTFDDGAEKTLKQLYREGWELERNEDGNAVMIIPYKNEYNANLADAYINVKRSKRNKRGK